MATKKYSDAWLAYDI